jgi:hypothetical protein
MKQNSDAEEKLFILDLLKKQFAKCIFNGKKMYSEETVINIIKQVIKYVRGTPSDEIRQKLILYDKFMSTHDFNGRLLSPDQAVDEFLKQE